MKKVKLGLLIGGLLILSACSSAITSADGVGLIPPELKIRQLGGPGVLANQLGGPTPVNFEIQVYNPSGETIELERIDLQTLGIGAYTISNASRPFDKPIPSDKTITVTTWVGAIAGDTIIGVNGPATLRITAYFSSEFGKFKQIYTQNVNTRLDPTPPSD